MVPRKKLVRVSSCIFAFLDLSEPVQVELALEAGVLFMLEILEENVGHKCLHVPDVKRTTRSTPRNHIRAFVRQDLV